MKYLSNISLLSFLMLMACEQVVEIELPEYEPQISLFSYYYFEDSRIEAVLFKSFPLDSLTDYDFADATVLMYENGQFLAKLENNGSNSRYGYTDLPEIISGNTYMLTAQAEGFPGVSATQIMPYPPTATLSQFINNSSVIVDDKRQDIFKITLEDDPDTNDYYEFRIFTRDKEDAPYGNWQERNLRSPYSQVITGEKILYLPDNSFNGESRQIELFSNSRDTTRLQIRVLINAITRDKYLFFQSVKAYQEAQYNPFAEPVIIHTNVENGQGIFSMENKTEIFIE